jgi:nucleoside-diphosphate-sugar epimerase
MAFEFVASDNHPPADSATALQLCYVGNSAAVAALFRTSRVRAVIHLAVVLPTASRSNPELATRVNIVGTTNMIDAAVNSAAQ